MKKIISAMIALMMLVSVTSVFAVDQNDRLIEMCYDENGRLVYSRLLRPSETLISGSGEREWLFRLDLPSEYSFSQMLVYDVQNGKFIKGQEKETDTDTSDSYVSKLLSSLPSDKNYVISPLSLKMAMMMLANGAMGDTKTEISDTFGVTDIDACNAQMKEMIDILNTTENGDVNIANSIWFNKDYYGNSDADFSEEFKNVITDSYKGTAEAVTNKNSVEAVNDWVREQTKGKITNLIPEASRKYLAALVNAIYMKADWIDPFKKEATYEEIFTDTDGNEASVDFMHQTDHFDYYEDGDTKIVRLPYTNGMSMYIVLGDTKNFESDIENMLYSKVSLSIPKFKIEYSTELSDILKVMGVNKAFADNNADFASMMQNVPDPLKIDTVLQKAIIEVDEKGTEAAAATAIMMGATMALGEPEPVVEFKADKPFTYYITDNTYGEVFFAGRYVKAE